MPLFITDEEYTRYSHDPSLITQKADSFIKNLYNQFETEKAQFDARSVNAEQNCAVLEQKFVSVKAEFDSLQVQCDELKAAAEDRLSEVAKAQADKHQIYTQSIGKDGEIERLSLEASELKKSRSQLLQLIEHKDLEINEKNSSIKAYLDKIVALTDTASAKESRINELEAEHSRVHASLARLSQEKELVERHNLWLNDELTSKVNSFLELRKAHNELEADMSSKLADLERTYNDTSSSLKWKDDKVKELESKLEALQNEFCSSKDVAAATEERLSAELSTVNKLVELYKENSDEWSKKAGELEGVIKALETHAGQVEKDYKERLDKETSTRIEFENEVSRLKEKLEKCEAVLENSRNSDQINLLQLGSYNTKAYGDHMDVNSNAGDDNLMLVPSIPAGISGTALAASLLRDGWSLVKMYEKYHETLDALRHEQLGRKQSESVLERVVHEIKEKADVIMEERAEHERMVEAYDTLIEKLQHSVSEQSALERAIQELKAELKRHERNYNLAQKENVDLQKQVTVLLKECRDIQLRGGGSFSYDSAVENQLNVILDNDDVFSERLLTFKDINGLVEQNVQLRGLVRVLTEQIESKEAELKENFDKELQNKTNETTSKVNAILARAEEQAQMIESLRTSVAMYKKLYEEEHKRHFSHPQLLDTPPMEIRNNAPLLLEGSHDALTRAQEKAYERIKLLEEEATGLRGEIITLKSQNNKLSLEATFAHDKLERFMKDFDHQREEANGILARNVEFSQLIVDYQRKIREASESLHIAEDLSRKLNMEVSVLKREKEILVNSEKRAFEEVRSTSERLQQLQATLNTIQSAEEVREEARSANRMSQEDYVKRAEREWADAKKELQEERENSRRLALEHESAMRGSMQRIEEMSKELANALRAVNDANARASAAEERLSHFEKSMNSEVNNENALVTTTKDDMVLLREELETLRVAAQDNKDHMLQYKNLVHMKEAALEQMEESHENFKAEAEKVKKSLEDEVLSLKEQVNQLQDGYNSKAKEAASAATSQEEALSSSLSEISKLREECTAKMLQIESLESQMLAMKDNLEKEHQRWRTAQDNYERQVILQSDTIQELTKTSQALALIQEKANELQRAYDILKNENNELKSKWETEKLVLEEAKDRAEKKFNEVNEQNKILHDQLEALHIKSAEMSRGSVAESSGNIDDGGLQNVVKYLRRSKEIAETEISLLKQEKLRLQSQLEGAVKAESAAQDLLRVERENSRSVHFTEDEFKALQVQVREMNLLRESNVQLREENKHNFEECQKLRQFTHTSKVEIENLQNLLGERQNEVAACKREIETQKKDRNNLEKRVGELLDRLKEIDPEDYGRLKVDVQKMNVKLLDKDRQLEENKKLVSEKQDVIVRLEQELSRSKVEIDERESKIKSIVQTEAASKAEGDKHRKAALQYKRKSDGLLKENDILTKKNAELSKQLADSNATKRNNVDTVGEQAEKDAKIQMLEETVEKLRDESRDIEEKDRRIQTLEKILERLREDVKKGKDEVRVEKAKNQKTESEKEIRESQEKSKVAEDMEKTRKRTSGPGVSPPTGGSIGDFVDPPPVAATGEVVTATPVSTTMQLTVPAAQKTRKRTSGPAASPPTGGSIGDFVDPPPVVATGEVVTATPVSTTMPLTVPAAQNRVETAKPLVTSKPKVAPRKMGRKLVRPHILKPEQPKGDTDMSETVGAKTQLSARKRPSEEQDGSNVRESSSADVAAPLVKKSKGSEQPHEGGVELQSTRITSDTLEGVPLFTEENVVDENQTMKEEEELETADDTAVEDQTEIQNDRSDIGEESMNKPIEAEVSEDPLKDTEMEHEQSQPATGEAESEPEDGEMVSDSMIGQHDGGQEMGESQFVEHQIRSPSPMPVEDEMPEDTLGDMEVGSPLLTMEDNEEGEIEADETIPERSADKLKNDGTDEAVVMAEEAAIDDLSTATTTTAIQVSSVAEKLSATSSMAETSAANQDGSAVTSVSTSGLTEVKPEEPVADTVSTTINLNERAKLRASLRMAGNQPSPSVARGRGRIPRGRTPRGGRTGRGGPTSGS